MSFNKAMLHLPQFLKPIHSSVLKVLLIEGPQPEYRIKRSSIIDRPYRAISSQDSTNQVRIHRALESLLTLNMVESKPAGKTHGGLTVREYKITEYGLLIFLGLYRKDTERRIGFVLEHMESISRNNPALLPAIFGFFRYDLPDDDKVFLTNLVRRVFSSSFFRSWFQGAWFASARDISFPVELLHLVKRREKSSNDGSIGTDFLMAVIEEVGGEEVERFCRLIARYRTLDLDHLVSFVDGQRENARTQLAKWTHLSEFIQRTAS